MQAKNKKSKKTMNPKMWVPPSSKDHESIFGKSSRVVSKRDPEPTVEITRAISLLHPESTAEEYKCIGNLCIGHGMFSAAIKHYTSALERDPLNEILLSNRSAAYLQSALLTGATLALKDADKVISLKGEWFKGHLRRADALHSQKKWDAAIEAYSKSIRLNPGCTTAADSLRLCQREKSLLVENSSSSAVEGKKKNPCVERKLNPEVKDTEDLIQSWGQDTLVRNDVTARRKYKASIEEAERTNEYKESLLNRFRDKLSSDEVLRDEVVRRLEREKLSGDGLDYKTLDGWKPLYSKGTDRVGHSISSDAYKCHTHQSNAW